MLFRSLLFEDGIAKLFAGLVFYMQAFPDKVVDGFPSSLTKPGMHKHKNIFTLLKSEKIFNQTVDRYIAPHIRNGYYRGYWNERYVNMRFQVAWVNGCYVGKAKAKTVLGFEEVDRQEREEKDG